MAAAAEEGEEVVEAVVVEGEAEEEALVVEMSVQEAQGLAIMSDSVTSAADMGTAHQVLAPVLSTEPPFQHPRQQACMDTHSGVRMIPILVCAAFLVTMVIVRLQHAGPVRIEDSWDRRGFVDVDFCSKIDNLCRVDLCVFFAF